MKQRCRNTNDPQFDYYGGRGIKVCERWLELFDNFYADMGARPSPKHSIDRINNDGNYEPGNCRWATAQEQATNRRNNVFIEYDGKTQHVSAWAREIGVCDSTIYYRLKEGWPLEQVLAPARPYLRAKLPEQILAAA